MKVVDELMTPGCPQCAIKHLSAALYFRAKGFSESIRWPNWPAACPPPADRILLARAYINLGEVLIGYKSHLWFAVGLLQKSEEEGLRLGSETHTAREARLLLEKKGLQGAREAMEIIFTGAIRESSVMEFAHVEEARRELPGFSEPFFNLDAAIEKIHAEYFDLPEATVAEGEENKKQGEPEMATAKKSGPVAKTAGKTKVPAATAAKATHAACKGGKCKGKSCKK